MIIISGLLGLLALRPGDSERTVIWRSEAFQAVVNLFDRVAPTDSTVLILGETGVGKRERCRAWAGH